MRSASTLAWRNLTGYPLRNILTALAIVLGVGMVLAASIVGQAASQGAADLSERGPHIDLELLSRDGGTYNRSILDALTASLDVVRVSPSLRVEAELLPRPAAGGAQPGISPLTLLGVEPEAYQALHDLELAGGAFLDGPDTIVLPVAVAIDHDLYVGDKLQVRARGQDTPLTLTVAGRLRAESGMDALSVDANTAFVPLAVAQALAGAPDAIDHADVGLRPGVDADVERVKADLARAVGPDLAIVRAVGGGVMGNVVLVQGSLAVVGLIILFAAGFVILNAFAMSVTARTREIGALRALGMTRRQVMSGVLVEAGLLGLMGTAVGMLVGLGLAWAVMRVMGTLGAADAPLTVPWWGVALSVTVGLGVTLVAALQPAWRASRVSPIAAVRPGRTAAVGWYVRPGGGRRVGAVLMGLLLVGLPAFGLLARPVVFVALPVMLIGQAALLGATVLLLPALVDPVIALCRPALVRWLGTEGRLAADNLGRNVLRTALTAGALTAGLTIIVATSGFMTAGLKGSVSRVRSMGNEDGFVTIDLAQVVASGEMSFQNFFQFLQQDQGFDLDPVAHALAPLVASGTIEVIRYRFQTIPPEISPLPGAPGSFVEPEVWLRIGNFDFFEGDPERALGWMQRGRAVLLTPIVAERLGVGVGDTLPLRTPQGEVDFTVAGIGGGALLMTAFPYADGETYFGVTTPSFLGIVVPDRTDARIQAALAQVEKAIEPFPDLVLHDYRSSLDPLLDMVDRLQLLLDGLLLLAVVVAGLGVVNTQVINVAERRREIGLLRAVGATQRQVRRAIVAEAATLGLLAALVASVLGVLMLLTWGVLILPNGTASLGVRPDWETIRLTIGDGLRDAGIASLVALVFGPLVAALAAYPPARRAARMDVVEATRSEQVALKSAGARRPESRRVVVAPPTWTMAWRNLHAARYLVRTVLSATAVALGVAMVLSPGIVSSGVSSAWTEGESTMAWITDMFGIVFGGIGVALLAAAGFLIFNAFAMAVTQQRRQIGVLRSLGMTRRQVMRQVLIEATIVGGMGTVAGLVAGPLLGQGILAVMRQMGVEVGESGVSIGGILLAIAMGLAVTLLSALLPARRAARVAPLAALRASATLGIEASRPSPWPWVGLAILVSLTIYLVFAPPGAWSGLHPPWDLLIAMLLWGVWLAGLGFLAHTLVGGLVRALRALLSRFGGTIGRLISDNLARAPRRVTLTVLTFAVGLALVVGVGGLLAFSNGVLVSRRAARALEQIGWYVYPFDRTSGVAQISDFDAESLALDPAVIEDVRLAVAERAHVGESYMVLVPEISSPAPGFPSFLGDVQELVRPGGFDFIEGDWETALPLLEREGHCGLLISPGIAGQHGVGAGDTLTVQGIDGPVACVVAGVGTGGFVPMARIGSGARDVFIEAGRTPDVLAVIPEPGADLDLLEADLYALADRHGDSAWISRPEDEVGAVLDTSDQLQAVFNGLLLLAAIAAVLGTINTMMMNVVERRHELGLLRAVGATRRQVAVAVTGEAALMGLIGSLLGTCAGVGMGVIFALAYGGISFGFMDLALWPAAGETVLPALRSGALSFVVSPLLAAAAAAPALRGILRGSVVETLSPERR